MRYSDGSDTGDRLTMDYTDISLLCYHRSAPGITACGEIQRGAVTPGRIWTWCLCFTYTLAFTVSLVLERVRTSEYTKYE